MPERFRSLFLSDLHLGARASHPRAVLDFLAEHEAATIYLVGDILDIWHGGHVHWTPTHEAVMSEFERRARSGTRVVYLAGNHDAALRSPGAARLPAGWELREALVHRAGDGRRYLVLHGDQADNRLLRLHAMTRLGSRADALARGVDAWLGRRLELWARKGENSPIRAAIRTFSSLFVMGRRFERRLVALAGAAGTQGVICGHSHKPGLREIDGLRYANCGDWVDSYTALVEDRSGALRLLDWSARAAARAEPAQAGLAEAPAMARGAG
ncbi:UDP-2,3-diacylglucosamine diphosphatase [Sinisalibacter lacisalsi]|uniref:UDP-2,3-diacylglucosamine hydrolase n=1 Tax=Sinisalibacter lacisalsi TaxID=1526570 RepID=A0ABQ1QTD7_9RHOB|nr:UDP-2,3-diacylglucosamine diphosphatase [Sinisalibacter lacisalsi]GGD42775.1 UDP-2,3-diacylglucosamine hydrolase [Sinisalibacter lacisalsi]